MRQIDTSSFVYQDNNLEFVSYARLSIYTQEEILSLSSGELLDLENIGYETFIRTKKALDKMGIAW